MAKTIAAQRVWNGHDNTIELILLEEGSPANLSGVDRVTLDVGGALQDSAVLGFGEGNIFDTTIDPAGGRLTLRLGDLAGDDVIPAGIYPAVELVVYDPSNPDGVVWGSMPLIVED